MTDNNAVDATLIIKENLISITTDQKIVGISFKFRRTNDWSVNYENRIKNNWFSKVSTNDLDNEGTRQFIFYIDTSLGLNGLNENYLGGVEEFIIELGDERIKNDSITDLDIIKIDENNNISKLENVNIIYVRTGNIYIDYQEVDQKGEINIYTSEGFPIRGIQFECSPDSGSNWDSSVIQTIDNDEFIGFTTNPNENYILETGKIFCMVIPNYENINSLSYQIRPSEGVDISGNPNPSLKLQLPGKLDTSVGITNLKLIKYIDGDETFNTFFNEDDIEIFYPNEDQSSKLAFIEEQKEEKYELLAKTSTDLTVRAKNQFGFDFTRILNNKNSNAFKDNNKTFGNRNIEKFRFSDTNIKGITKYQFKEVAKDLMFTNNKNELFFDATDFSDEFNFFNSITRKGTQRSEIMAILPSDNPANIPLIDLTTGNNVGYYALLKDIGDAVDFKINGGYNFDNEIFDVIRVEIVNLIAGSVPGTITELYQITVRKSDDLDENVKYVKNEDNANNASIFNYTLYESNENNTPIGNYKLVNDGEGDNTLFETNHIISLLTGTSNEIIFTLGGASTGGQEDTGEDTGTTTSSSGRTGGDPYITPIYGPNYKLASRCGYYRYLSDMYGDFVINAQVYRLPKNTEQGLDYMYNLLFTENKDLRNKLIDDGFYFNKFLIRNKFTKTNLIIDLDKWNIQDLNNKETISFRKENEFYLDNVHFKISNKMYETKMFPYNNLKVIKNMKMSIETKHYGLVELNFEIFLNTQVRSGLAIKTEKTIRLDNSSGLIVCYQRNKDIKIPRLKYIKTKQPAVLKKEINIITEIFKDGKGKDINIDMIQS